MRKLTAYITSALLMILITHCGPKQKQPIVGVWHLERMNINGTDFEGASMGNWMWEFNEEGGFLTNVSGAIEKGWYKLEDNRLVLQITDHENRPEQTYEVQRLDSAVMELSTVSHKNTATLAFNKMQHTH